MDSSRLDQLDQHVSHPASLGLWQALTRAHEALVRRLEEDMAACDLSLAGFDVLSELAATKDGRLRMNELADRMPLSRSGVTRLVDRLQREGLVVRSTCSYDARGTFAVLTAMGEERLAAAIPAHRASIETYCGDKLTPEETTLFLAVLTKLTPVAVLPTQRDGRGESGY